MPPPKPSSATRPASSREERRLLTVLVAITLVITAVVYRTIYANQFLNWDDPYNVVQNAAIRGLSWPHWRVFFTQPLMGMYSPLVYVSYAIDFATGGFNVSAYHTTNLLLHLFNTVLVAAIVFALVRRAWPAGVIAALFALHPANVAAVAPVSVRSSLLYSAFYLAAYWMYLAHVKRPSALRIGVTFALFLCSCLSKSAAMVFPLLMLATDWYCERPWSASSLLEKAPFAAASIVFGALTLHYRDDVAVGSAPVYSLIDRLGLAAYGLAHYVYTLVAPVRLSAYYPYPGGGGGLPSYAWLALVAIAVSAVAIWSLRAQRALAFGAVFFVIHVALILKIVPLGEEFAADRYLYLASIGIFFAVVETIRRLGPSVQRGGLVVAALVLVGCAVLSQQRVAAWQNSIAFYDDILAKYPDAAFAYTNRAAALLTEQQDAAGAVKDCDAAIRVNPRYADAYFNRGTAEMLLRRFEAARADAGAAIGIDKGRRQYFQLRAEARLALGDAAGARDDSSQAIALDPQGDIAKAYLSRGVARISLDDTPGAVEDFTRAIALDPSMAAAYQNRGNARALLRDAAGAIADFTTAIQLDPSNAAALYTRGLIRERTGDHVEACRDLVSASNLGRTDARELAQQICR